MVLMEISKVIQFNSSGRGCRLLCTAPTLAQKLNWETKMKTKQIDGDWLLYSYLKNSYLLS